MGFRLSKIYTRSGDQGTTALADGIRLQKDDLRIECIGDVDELNSFIGLIACNCDPDHSGKYLEPIQNQLFNIGAYLSYPNNLDLQEGSIFDLERWIDQINENLPPLKEFILPGGSTSAAQCHIARAVCRRVEHQLWRLNKIQQLDPLVLQFMNRLSDWLFVFARHLNTSQGHQEIYWQSNRIKKTD